MEKKTNVCIKRKRRKNTKINTIFEKKKVQLQIFKLILTQQKDLDVVVGYLLTLTVKWS